MARPPLQPAEVERFRQRLCEVALQRFAENGFAGVTLRALARDLGCSYATPYRYFRDKEHIFAAVRALAYERFGAALESAAVGEPDPERRLRLMLKSFVRFAKEEPQAYRMMFELHQPGPDLHPEYWAKERQTWTIWEDEVRHAVEAGVLIGDPPVVAHLFWSGIHGVVALYLAGKLILGRKLEELAAPMIEALMIAHTSQQRQD